MKVHDEAVKGYSGTLEELAIDVGNLRYDSLSKFLDALGIKILEDAIKDQARGRKKLYAALKKTWLSLSESATAANETWKFVVLMKKKRLKKQRGLFNGKGMSGSQEI